MLGSRNSVRANAGRGATSAIPMRETRNTQKRLVTRVTLRALGIVGSPVFGLVADPAYVGRQPMRNWHCDDFRELVGVMRTDCLFHLGVAIDARLDQKSNFLRMF